MRKLFVLLLLASGLLLAARCRRDERTRQFLQRIVEAGRL